MIFAAGLTWFNFIPIRDDQLFGWMGVESQTTLFAHGMFSFAIIFVLALFARMGLNAAKAKQGVEQHYAQDKLTARTFFELFGAGVMSLMTDLMPKKDAKIFFPLVGALFLYIYVNNMLSLVPGLSPATDNINTNVGMALTVFLVFMFVGLSRDPVGFIKHLWGPLFVTGFLIFPVELLGLFLRPVSLSLRLTGNLFGDHTAFGVISHLAPPVVPVMMLGLALFVSFMQAFVFSLLTAVYISMSLPHADHDDHH